MGTIFPWQCELHSAIKTLSGELITIIYCTWYPPGRYMRVTKGSSSVQLAVPSVVSILISSDFLQMHPLVEDCLNFMSVPLSELY